MIGIDQKQIPREVTHALVMNLDKPWPEAIAAALNAWPGAFVKFSPPDDCEILCLLLPQEPRS
jgi:hypothetical protein